MQCSVQVACASGLHALVDVTWDVSRGSRRRTPLGPFSTFVHRVSLNGALGDLLGWWLGSGVCKENI